MLTWLAALALLAMSIDCIEVCCDNSVQDAAVVKEIAATDNTLDVKSLLQKIYVQCFELDLTSYVASSEKLMCIHSSAEEFDATAEEAFVPFQVSI